MEQLPDYCNTGCILLTKIKHYVAKYIVIRTLVMKIAEHTFLIQRNALLAVCAGFFIIVSVARIDCVTTSKPQVILKNRADTIVLRIGVLHTRLERVVIKLAPYLEFFFKIFQLVLNSPAQAVHGTRIDSDRHPIEVILDNHFIHIVLDGLLHNLIQTGKPIPLNALTSCGHILLVIAHLSRVDVAHKVWLTPRANTTPELLILDSIRIIIVFNDASFIVVPVLRHICRGYAFYFVNRVLLIKLSADNTIRKFIVLFTTLLKFASHIKHRCNSVCCTSNIISKSADIRFNKILFGWNFFLTFTLDTKNNGFIYPFINENSIICRKRKISIKVFTIERSAHIVPRICDKHGFHIAIPVFAILRCIQIHAPNICHLTHRSSKTSNPLDISIIPKTTVNLTGFQ